MAWREPLLSAGQIILIVPLTWLLQRILTRGITCLGARYPQLPVELLMPQSSLLRFLLLAAL
jgi:hypothetical protein